MTATAPSLYPVVRAYFMITLMSLGLVLVPLYFWQRSDMTTEVWVYLSLGLAAGALTFPRLILTIGTTRHNYFLERIDHLYDGQPATIRLAAFLDAYYQAKRRPTSFTFADCFLWVNKSKLIADVDYYLNALDELEQSGSVVVDRPADGNLVITLTKQFHRRLRLARQATRQ
ncbi:TPA: hypothetical protein DEP96_00910 [Candidatus Uhrbacteria bacterium]|nr:hypothetical protein [Candidatus Uhrbacteria bacterium]